MAEAIVHISGRQPRRLAAALPGAAFLLTGVATGMLGAALPAMLREWGLNDRRGGLLLLCAWGGSTCGALLCRGKQRTAAVTGLALTGAALLLLSRVPGAVRANAALPLFLFYGLGLGVTMTALTLLSSQASAPGERCRVLTRLNMLWSVGACLSPLIAARALSSLRVNGLFAAMGLVFGAVALGLAVFGRPEVDLQGAAHTQTATLRFAPWQLYAFAALAVGVESALGGWLTTYAGRTAHGEAMVIYGTSAFWAGLLLSRALHATVALPSLAKSLATRAAAVAHATAVALAIALMVWAPGRWVYLPCTLLAGFGLGPLYPQVLAMVLERFRPREIFIVAGIGSAVMPWMTGAVSQATGSLRGGLLVPCAGAVALLALVMSLRAEPAPMHET